MFCDFIYARCISQALDTEKNSEENLRTHGSGIPNKDLGAPVGELLFRYFQVFQENLHTFPAFTQAKIHSFMVLISVFILVGATVRDKHQQQTKQ